MLSAALPLFHDCVGFCGKRDRGFCWHDSFLFSGSRRHAGSGTGAGGSANSSAVASANQAANEGACCSSATDFHHVALGMAFAFGKKAAGCDGSHFSIDFKRRESERELTRDVQPATRL